MTLFGVTPLINSIGGVLYFVSDIFACPPGEIWPVFHCLVPDKLPVNQIRSIHYYMNGAPYGIGNVY